MISQLQVIGHMPKKYLPINLFDIHVRLYRCVKIWRIFGQSSISPNFSGTKVSLHTVSHSRDTPKCTLVYIQIWHGKMANKRNTAIHIKFLIRLQLLLGSSTT